ncbi:hypothetical protein ACOLNO_002939 [Vibrio parahaemolyticus]
MKFDIYKTKYDNFISSKKLVKSLKDTLGHFPTFGDHLIAESKIASILQDSIAMNCLSEEFYFERTGRNLVFVNNSIVDMLNRAKFTATKQASIIVPKGFETFALCFEKNACIDVEGHKVKLYPCLITVLSKEEHNELVKEPFSKATGQYFYDNSRIRTSIALNYKVGDVNYRTCIDLSEVVESLENGVRDTDTESPFFNQHLNPDEQRTSNLLLKMAVKMLIFNASTDNEYLVSGFPKQCNFKLPDNRIRTHWNASHVNYAPSFKVGAHIRSAHFRNLQADRYYKNEYENLPKGSRWIMIQESFIGKSKNFTQKSKND